MQKVIIDEEFRLLLPTLDKVTYESLEKNILAHGVRDPLVVWNGVLIDGYNRYKICTTHDLPFTTVSLEFSSRDEVLHWIIENQIARRNLTSVELSHFRGLYYNAAKRIRSSGNNQYTGKSGHPQSEGDLNGSMTAKDVGKRFNVSKATIERDAKVADALTTIAEISPEAKQKILSGEVPVDRNKLQGLSKAPKEDVEKVVKQINDGTYNRNDYRKKSDSKQIAIDSLDISNDLHIPTIDTSLLPNREETNYINTIIGSITDSLSETQKSIKNKSNIYDLKVSLRLLIDSLEDLYGIIAADIE